MSRQVFCQFLNKETQGLDTPPMPGELGKRIFDNISEEGWTKWLQQLTMIINENQLNTADPAAIKIIEQHMVGFLFQEGEAGGTPDGFVPPGAKK